MKSTKTKKRYTPHQCSDDRNTVRGSPKPCRRALVWGTRQFDTNNTNDTNIDVGNL
jgi:hypothetical protein